MVTGMHLTRDCFWVNLSVDFDVIVNWYKKEK